MRNRAYSSYLWPHSFGSSRPSPSKEEAWTLSTLYTAVPWLSIRRSTSGNSTFQSGFILDDYGDSTLIYSNVAFDRHILYYKDLADPGFDIVDGN